MLCIYTLVNKRKVYFGLLADIAVFLYNLIKYGVYALVFFVLVHEVEHWPCHALVSAHPRRSQEIPVGGMERLPMANVQRLIHSMRRRCDACITAAGGATRYFWFDFIECFTTTFLRAHSWLNWVELHVTELYQCWIKMIKTHIWLIYHWITIGAKVPFFDLTPHCLNPPPNTYRFTKYACFWVQ